MRIRTKLAAAAASVGLTLGTAGSASAVPLDDYERLREGTNDGIYATWRIGYDSPRDPNHNVLVSGSGDFWDLYTRHSLNLRTNVQNVENLSFDIRADDIHYEG